MADPIATRFTNMCATMRGRHEHRCTAASAFRVASSSFHPSMRLTHARMSFMQARGCGNSVRAAAALGLRADDRFDPLIILGDLFKRGVIVELIPAGQRP